MRSNFRVLLFTPPRGLWRDSVAKPWNSTQPIGLAYVAAAVRSAGFTVELVDAYTLGLSASALRAKIEAVRPQVVGISSLTPQWHDAAKVAQIAKSVDAGIVTVAGGPHVTALPFEVVEDPHVDVAVIGEGELTLLDICEALLDGCSLESVAGIALNDDSPRLTETRPKNTDLDLLPFPAHDLLPEPLHYNPFPVWGKKGNFSCVISGRGCPYDCSFCDVTSQQGKQYRLRSAENVVAELAWLSRDFGVSMFSFRDPSLVCNRRRLMEICGLIQKHNLDIVWTCNGRANEVDQELLKAMKRAGCRVVQYGIEVGNADLLQQMKKVSKGRIAQAVRETRQAGISPHGYFLFGFSQETPANINETIAFAKELDLESAGFALMVPFPGTREFERCRQEGLLLSRDWHDYDVLGRPVFRHQNLSQEQLARALKRAYREFYLRPHIIFRHLSQMTSVSALRSYLHSAQQLF